MGTQGIVPSVASLLHVPAYAIDFQHLDAYSWHKLRRQNLAVYANGFSRMFNSAVDRCTTS